MADNKKAYSVSEVAQMLGISLQNAYALVRAQNGIPSIRVTPRRIIIPCDALNRWLMEQSRREQPV